MGFPVERVARVTDKLGRDDKKVQIPTIIRIDLIVTIERQ